MMHPAFPVLAVLLVGAPPAALAQELSTLKEVIDGQDDLTTLSSVLTKAGFDDEFGDPNNDLVTLCSPVNEAFDKMPAERLEQLLEDQFVGHLRDVLEFHGVPGKIFAEQVTNGTVAPTLNDEELTFDFVDDPVTGQTLVFVRTPNTPGSQVIEVNLEGNNGIAHKVSDVFLPDFWDKNLPTAIDLLDDTKYGIFKELFALAENKFTTLESGVATVLAPTDEALLEALGGQEGVDALKTDEAADIRDAILAAHIIPDIVLPSRNMASGDSPTSVENSDGSTISIDTETTTTNGDILTLITLNNILVSEADQFANNGLIHGIDGVVLTPPGPCTTIASIVCTPPEGFSTLCAAIQAAGLEDTLNDGTFTVFAPTDDAFANLPSGTVDALLNHIPSLTNVLLFHAVADEEIFSSDLECTRLIEMANGDDSRTYCVDGNFFQKGYGNSRDAMPEIISPDIVACNGVVHAVSEVMLPPDVFLEGAAAPPEDCASIANITCTMDGFSTLCAAFQASGLTETFSNHDDTFTVFAPNDDAFGNLPNGQLQALLDDIPALTDILLFHAAADAKVILSSDLECTRLTEMANGDDSRTYCVDGKLFQKGAGNSRDAMPEILSADIEACNGVIHVVSEVMLP